ncbi:hypothetical protein LCGC14_0356650 [marine sediment metagenome]|uniref:Photosynthesis system II assembly factor Ycf48/Hcf136-like domain-containing protein n=1 Tax=marine sediment metagenome TaxID=412755 RepID=A0A0F9T9D2_9ZZZZ|tara:strand:- start:3327 stop:4490 length:1164 start_codon:yes stop_codon:yes gene_type:complete
MILIDLMSGWLLRRLPRLLVVFFFANAVFSFAVAGSLASGTAPKQDESATVGLFDPLDNVGAIQPVPETQPTLSVARAGKRIIGVGLRGLIMMSNDEGESWTQIDSPVGSDLVQVRFRDEKHGWIVGHDSVFLATEDGGQTWSVLLDGRSLLTLLKNYYAGVADLDEFESESMLREFELAMNTSSDADVMATPFLDAYINEQGEGYVVGAFGMILRTTDNGGHWVPWIERTDNDRRMHLYSVSMSGSEAFISGEQGLVMRLDESSQRFVKTPTPYTGTFFGVSVSADTVLVYGLRGSLFASKDLGESWSKVETAQESAIVQSLPIGKNKALLISQRGGVLQINTKTLELKKVADDYRGAVFSAAVLNASDKLLLAQFSGVRTTELKP